MTHQTMQPVVVDGQGVHRFKVNAVVRYLLDHGGIDLTRLEIAYQTGDGFPAEDMRQFMQLIGYSVSGWAGLTDHRDADGRDYGSLDPAWDVATPGTSDAECITRALDLVASTSSANVLAQVVEILHCSPTGVRRSDGSKVVE